MDEDISYPGLTRMSDKPMHPRHMAPYSMHEANVIKYTRASAKLPKRMFCLHIGQNPLKIIFISSSKKLYKFGLLLPLTKIMSLE